MQKNNEENMKVLLFVNARDEKNMIEWVAHHLLLGFDEIHICDHKSIIPLKGQFDNFNKNGEKVFVTRYENEGGIKDILITAAAKYAESVNTDWMFYIDADEFFVINSDDTTNVKDLLKKYDYADSVSFNWLIFGSSFHVNEPEGMIIDNYTRSDLKLDHSLKTFIRPKEFYIANAHRSEVKNKCKAYHGNGTCLGGPIYHPFKENKHFTNNIEYYNSFAYIAHYAIQSEETYVRRKLRLPRDDWGSYRSIVETYLGFPITNERTIHSEFNEVENFSVKNKYSENIKKYIASLGYYKF